MIIGFCFSQFPDCGSAGSVHPRSLRERGMKKKMRGIVALCVALTMGVGSSALLAQKADPKKEVKRSKAEQIDFDTLVNDVDTAVAGRGAPPASGVSVTWDSNHFFRAPDGSTYVPFTLTVDKSQLAAPNSAVYLAVFD